MAAETGAWMPMYWGDYLGDTMHFSTFQHGCYLLLIAAYWRKGGPLLDDPESLARICRTSCDKLARYGKPVLAMFTSKDGLLISKRLEKEIVKSSARLMSARANGKAGGLAKSKLVTPTPLEGSKKESYAPQAGAPKSRGSRLPIDFAPPSDWIEDAARLRTKQKMPPADLATEALKFVNHFASAPGQKGVKLDWRRTWIVWALGARGNAAMLPLARMAGRAAI